MLWESMFGSKFRRVTRIHNGWRTVAAKKSEVMRQRKLSNEAMLGTLAGTDGKEEGWIHDGGEDQ